MLQEVENQILLRNMRQTARSTSRCLISLASAYLCADPARIETVIKSKLTLRDVEWYVFGVHLVESADHPASMHFLPSFRFSSLLGAIAKCAAKLALIEI